MKHFLLGTAKHTLKALGYGIAGGVAVLMVVLVLKLERWPDLKIWHTVELDAEFTADGAKSFEDYLSVEARLFQQLDERVYSRIEPGDRRLNNRYFRGSLSDPDRWSPNWNRTFELSAKAPRAGILLLHGMSDSPYSLRSLGETLHGAGAWVVGLRLPGHGTAPSGLVRVKWQDMAAAVRLSMDHLRDRVGDRPIYMVGYSNGGALAVHYALSALEDNALPSVDGMVLISPATGVSPLAAFAVWQARLGRLLGLEKLAWTDILPEYDPFKYGSFAVNAGDQVYRLTAEIQSKMKRLGNKKRLEGFPSVLAFQSAVDATVSTRALIDGLFGQLPENGHELVIFDINRLSEIEQVLGEDPLKSIETGLNHTDLTFTLSVVTNDSEKSRRVAVRRKNPGQPEITEMSIGLMWPEGLYSLSHVALPFSPNDSLYGGPDAGNSPGIALGDMALRGERGVLQIPAAVMLRLRWNPFYPYMERRLLEFVRLEGADRE
jgi:alpha-beta hydrolase superfamily lysophospholipase